MGPIYLYGAVIAVGLDLLAIWCAPSTAGIGVAIGKFVVVLYATFFMAMCAAPPATYVDPPISAAAAALILLWSSVPSVLGAIGRRLTR